MRNIQPTRKAQPPNSGIAAQSFDSLMAKGLRPRTRAEESRYGVKTMLAELKDADAWWPAQARAILEDARRCERIRLAAEADLMEELHDWQRKARKAKRDAKPKYSRAAMLALELRGAAQ